MLWSNRWLSHTNISFCNELCYNQKGVYSVVTQAVVDYQYRSLDVYTGWAGSVCLQIPFCTLGVNNRLLISSNQLKA